MGNSIGRISASICVTDLVNQVKAGHSAANIGKTNGKVYVNVTVWLNDEPDKFGNNCSFQLNSSAKGEAADKARNNGKSVYIGNGKFESSGGVPAQGSAAVDALDLGGAAPQNGKPWEQQGAAGG